MRAARRFYPIAGLLAAFFWGAVFCLAAEQDETIGRFYLADGLEARLWARSPMLFNPTNIDVDHRGRVWVAEAVNYRGFNNRKAEQRWHEEGDRIVILEDTDGDGAADRSSVFVQDRDLVAPLGIAVFDNQVLVSCSPSLILYTDKNRDGRFDPQVDTKEVFLTGFGGHDHDHGLHSLVSGPDGAWYLATGNAGPHQVTDRAGWTLRAGSGYTGGSPHNTANQPALVSDDGRVWVGGVALRVRPDGHGLSVIGHNFRNCYELCLDSLGNVFQNDNDDTIGCRTTWLMEYGNTGFASADGARTWQADRRPGQSIPTAHWRQDDPGVIPAGDIYGPGAPTGIAFYENGALGDRFRGTLLSCEAGRNVIWSYQPRPLGAGLALERERFLASVEADNPDYRWQDREADVRKWFRPSDVCVGADGAVYVADWFDPVVGGHQMDHPRAAGAIYRIVPQGSNPRTPQIDLSTLEGQLAALASPANNVRYLGFSRLAARGAAVLEAVEPMLSHENRYLAARATFLIAQLGLPGQQRIERLLDDEDAQRRLVALRALRRAGVDMIPLAKRLCRDASPAVRREVALALRDLPADHCHDLLLALAEGFDGQDRWYLEAFGTGCEGKEEAIYEALTAGIAPDEWDDALAALAWRLHPPSATHALRQRALSDRLELPARKQALDALAFIADKNAAQAMEEIARQGPNELRTDARWWLAMRQHNLWRGFTSDTRLTLPDELLRTTGIELPKEPVYESETILPGHVVEMDVDLTGARRLYLVVTDAGNGNSCDWADWLEPRLTSSQGDVPLTQIQWKQAHAGWGEVRINENCRGMPLHVAGREVKTGIGTHAPSVIVYELPPGGPHRLRAQLGLDDGRADLGGALHPSGSASVVFQVYHDGPTPAERAVQLAGRLQEPSLSADARQEVGQTLASFKEGGLQLIALAAQGRIPDDLKAELVEPLHRNPDLAVRAAAGQYFPRVTAAGERLPPLPELARLRGDAARGRTLFEGKASCAKCHHFAGQGANVGPDLTEIQGKFDRTRLLDAIVNPSAAIVFGYESWLITTEEGKVLSGTIVGAGDPLIVADAEGRQHAIPQAEIAERQRLTHSIMPTVDGLDLKPQDLADLAEFLLSSHGKKEPVP